MTKETPDYYESNRRALDLSNRLLEYEQWIGSLQSEMQNTWVDVGVVAAARIIIESMIDDDWAEWRAAQEDRTNADFARAGRGGA